MLSNVQPEFLKKKLLWEKRSLQLAAEMKGDRTPHNLYPENV
ncbi:hypothetical protein [Nostoc sp. NZL]|nr:hypothetical protein [Nostoc sp. NZL]